MDNLDNLGKKAKLLSCNQYINIATMNITYIINKTGISQMLLSIYGISIIGIVDHTLVHDEVIKLEKLGEYTILAKSAFK